MNCSSCGHAIPERAKFCAECGIALPRSCAACGSEVLASAKFCAECGAPQAGVSAAPATALAARERTPRAYTPKHLAERILATRAALEGERKQVTVLFADVKGSLELAGELGAEAWHGVLDRFFQLLADGIHRFEGTVNQYTGDGIMALFGAPLAHEDHAQRACYAALALQDELARFATELKRAHGVSFSTRVGIHSGEVVVGKIGDDLRMDYTAQGQTVGLAQRLEALASPDTVYLSDETARRVAGYFTLEDLGEFRVKGVAEPLRVHRLVGPGALRTRFDVSRARGLSRFVGRAAELALLESALERLASGHGGVVGIVAEAGTGKSRLCFELEERSRARGIAVRHAQAFAHTQAIPLVPVLELYRQIFGIAPDDSPAIARQKIAGAVVLLDAQAADALPLWFELLGVPDPERPAPPLAPDVRERRLLDLMRRLSEARAKREPALVVLEDLHWADPASVRFAAALCEAAEVTGTLVVANFRPEFQPPWAGRSWYQQLALRPLDASATAELLASWLGGDASLAGLVAMIQSRAAGNPFFVEEIVLSLVESGALVGKRGNHRLARPVEALALPATVQALLAARIDRLGDDEKRALSAAAVIGLVFPEALLARASGLEAEALRAALARLSAAELIVERALYPEAEYAFRHPLVQEVAYQAQLGAARARTHGAVARALEETAGTRADELSPLIAQHYDAASDPEPALRWGARAAESLVQRDGAAAAAMARRALAHAGALELSEENYGAAQAARLALSAQLQRVGSDWVEFAQLIAEGKRAAEARGDRHTLARFLANEGFAASQAGNPEWEPPLARAEAIAEELGSPALRCFVAHQRSVCCFIRGMYARAEEHSDRALQLLDRDPNAVALWSGYDVRSRCRQISATVQYWRGRPARALAELDAILPSTHPADRFARAAAYSLRARARGALFGHAAQAEDARAASEHYAAIGDEASALVWIGEALMSSGKPSEALAPLAAARDLQRRAGVVTGQWISALTLAQARLACGDSAEAEALADEAIDMRRRAGAPVAYPLLVRARIGLAARDSRRIPAIEADLDEGLASACEHGVAMVEGDLLEACAELASLRGDAAAREAALRAALAIWESGGAAFNAERVRRALAE